MNNDKLSREWIDMAPAWIERIREHGDAIREGLLDAPMLAACGDVTGLKVLDCGCGEGRFTRLLVDRGAESVLGLDLCRPMIEAAIDLQTERDSYEVADVQNLYFLEGETFDLAVSYLNQCDLPNVGANNREVFRVLKPGGRFIVANLHPMRSAVGGWHKTEDGTKQHVILDRYFDETERQWIMLGCEVTNFHRSLSTYLDGYLEARFAIQRIVEPTATAEALARDPGLEDEQRVPNFIIYVLRRP